MANSESITSEAVRATGNRIYRVCARCVMDTSDANIRFDEAGVCDYCRNYERSIAPMWSNDDRRLPELLKLAAKIRASRGRRKYDCIIGVSGGLDSSFAAYTAVRVMGLRPLLYHVDAGWNTEQAVANIERLVDGLGLDLHTDVIDWKEMADLQCAFFRAQVPDQDMPQDIAFFSSLYKFARQNGIRYVLTGANFSTECCREPEEWGAYPGVDTRLIRTIHARFGQRSLKTFPMIDILTHKILYRYIFGIRVVRPLNSMRFIKAEAEKTLADELGWRKFSHKHHESRFTRFFEDYWLPRKFGYDKRRAHYSSLIQTGQLQRDEALERLKAPIMPLAFLEREFEYVSKKIGMPYNELREIFLGNGKITREYNNKHKIISLGWSFFRRVGIEKRLLR